MPGTVPDTGETAGNKLKKVPSGGRSQAISINEQRTAGGRLQADLVATGQNRAVVLLPCW